MIDDLQGRIPPLMKWCLAGMGAAGGWQFAQAHGSPIPASCVVAGAAAGFCLLVVGFAGLRILKALTILAMLLVVLDYAVLIPYGYGDHLPGWLGLTRSLVDWLRGLHVPRGDF